MYSLNYAPLVCFGFELMESEKSRTAKLQVYAQHGHDTKIKSSISNMKTIRKEK